MTELGQELTDLQWAHNYVTSKAYVHVRIIMYSVFREREGINYYTDDRYIASNKFMQRPFTTCALDGC